MNPDSDEIIRVSVRRTISYQGPRSWVEGTLQRSITEAVEFGPGKFVIGRPFAVRNVRVDQHLKSQGEDAQRKGWGVA